MNKICLIWVLREWARNFRVDRCRKGLRWIMLHLAKEGTLLLPEREQHRYKLYLLPEQLLRLTGYNQESKEAREMSVEHNQVLIVSKVAKWQPVRIESKRRVRNVAVIANREHKWLPVKAEVKCLVCNVAAIVSKVAKWQPVRTGVKCPGCNQVAIANREHKWQPARIEARCRGCNRMAIVVKDGIG